MTVEESISKPMEIVSVDQNNNVPDKRYKYIKASTAFLGLGGFNELLSSADKQGGYFFCIILKWWIWWSNGIKRTYLYGLYGEPLHLDK